MCSRTPQSALSTIALANTGTSKDFSRRRPVLRLGKAIVLMLQQRTLTLANLLTFRTLLISLLANVARPARPLAKPDAPSREPAAAAAGRRDAEARLVVPLEKAYAGGRERIRLEDGRSLEVNMPGGMVSGQRIRLKGQGTAGGDLYLKIEVLLHDFFKLEGTDIVCELPITPAEAVLGGQIEAPTLDGWVKMTLPAGVRSGQRLRLGSKGYPAAEGGKRGDQLVQIRVEIPQSVTVQERSLYEKLRAIEGFKPRAGLPI